MREYFEILGLPESASYEEVKLARMNLLKEYHPDLYIGDKVYAEEKTAKINQAYTMLSDFFENKNTLFNTEKVVLEKKIDEDISNKGTINKPFKEEQNLYEKNQEKVYNLVDREKVLKGLKKGKSEEICKKEKFLIDSLICVLVIIIIIIFFLLVF